MSIYKKGGYAFFYNGPFSNWFPCEFTVGGIKYNCGEQYMMHTKALFFKDKETAKMIIQEVRPAKQKELGRSVKNYNDLKWSDVRYELVKRGLREKFNQNSDLKELLVSHKHLVIVEASPTDRVWGIGYDDRNAINNINNWGENLLGKILTELAIEIMAEPKPTPNEVKNDLIKLLKIMPNVTLAQNQNLCEMLYELRKKYNVPILRSKTPPQPSSE